MIDWSHFDGIIGGEATREQVVAIALSWIDVKYHHQGDSRVGVDCGGLIKAILMDAGLLPRDYLTRLPDVAHGYSRAPDGVLLKQACAIAKASGTPNREKVGKVTRSKLQEIAQLKMKDLNTLSLEQAVKLIEGTARSMGIEVAG